MADEGREDALTDAELESQTAEALPDREAMSVVWIEPDVVPPEEVDTGTNAVPVDDDAESGNEPLRGGERL